MDRREPRSGQSDRVAETAQWERAHQAWTLSILAREEELSEAALKGLYRALRVKRGERSAFLARLPGVVRRGAQVDLEPLRQAISELGVDCALEARHPEVEEGNSGDAENAED